MHVSTVPHAYTCVHACTYTHVRAQPCTHTHVHTCTHSTCTHACEHSDAHIRMRTCMHVHTCACKPCTHIRMHAHMHTWHTHACTHTPHRRRAPVSLVPVSPSAACRAGSEVPPRLAGWRLHLKTLVKTAAGQLARSPAPAEAGTLWSPEGAGGPRVRTLGPEAGGVCVPPRWTSPLQARPGLAVGRAPPRPGAAGKGVPVPPRAQLGTA